MVTSRVRTVLPQDALLQLELADISRVGAPGRTVALREIWTGGRQFPIPFDIPYSSAAIDSDRSYAVQVRVTQGNRLLFKNLTVYMVITNGIKSNLEVVVEPVPGSGGVSR
jgi:putative lipoprotein